MITIYEQGDIVYDMENFYFGIVLADYGDVVKILELAKKMFINKVPKGAVQYDDHIDLKNAFKLKVVEDVILAHPNEKGGVEE